MGHSLSCVRLFCDERGESHFENVEVAAEEVDFAPPAPPLGVSVVGDADRVLLLRMPEGWDSAAHPSPHRQLMSVLSGEAESVASDGTHRRFGPGSLVLVEDVRGKGHTTRCLAEAVLLSVRLTDQSGTGA